MLLLPFNTHDRLSYKCNCVDLTHAVTVIVFVVRGRFSFFTILSTKCFEGKQAELCVTKMRQHLETYAGRRLNIYRHTGD